MTAYVDKQLGALLKLQDAADARGNEAPLKGLARGLAFQIAEGVGQIERQASTPEPDLREAERALRPFGVRIGRRTLFLPQLLKPAPASLSALLWAVHGQLEPIPSPPVPGLTSFAVDKGDNKDFLAAAFHRVVAGRAIRLDILERIENELFEGQRKRVPAAETLKMLVSLLGCGNDEAVMVARALDWDFVTEQRDTGPVQTWRRTEKKRKGHKEKRRSVPPPDSPFSGLKALIPAD